MDDRASGTQGRRRARARDARTSRPAGRAAPARAPTPGLQVVRRADERRVRAGISAVVGPNGSGKSNLADALRWALGEQGRALRSRKAEDVIWAGSDKRAAQGMADVTLVLDNADGLLPVDFQVLELGRGSIRSGENDYLLNKSRIRLRDLVDLLDARTSPTTPSCSSARGWSTRRSRCGPRSAAAVRGGRRGPPPRATAPRAEEQLAESEANLARVEDILGELRPQAAGWRRRPSSRRTGPRRRRSCSTRSSLAHARALARRGGVDRRPARIATGRTDAIRRRDGRAHGRRRSRDGSCRSSWPGAPRSSGSVERRTRRRARRSPRSSSARRDPSRSFPRSSGTGSGCRRASRGGGRGRRGRALEAVQVPPRDIDLDARLAEAERELADALAELGALRSAAQAEGQQLAALRRAAATREAEGRDRRVDGWRTSSARRPRRRTGDRRGATTRDAPGGARDREGALGACTRGERSAAAIARRPRPCRRERGGPSHGPRACASRRAPQRRRAAPVSTSSRRDSPRRGARHRRGGEAPRGSAAARRGPRRRPRFRAAVEAALADRSRAYVVGSASRRSLAAERGGVVVEERAAAAPADDRTRARSSARRSRPRAAGPSMPPCGGPTGRASRRCLARCVAARSRCLSRGPGTDPARLDRRAAGR
jgi:chromosome segregation protein